MGNSLFKASTSFLLLFLALINYSLFGQDLSNSDTYKYTNNLINETSSYLLDHAQNPVNWQPWNDTLLKQAKEDNKLIIVSVGYSSCHWCHVMAKESFEDEEVAKIMNSNFINIKVDREERPDIDQLYMTAVQLIKGQGGWPLNVILLPNGKPLYGGTYHTKEQWIQTLKKISELYKKNPDKLFEFGEKITDGIEALNLLVPQEDKKIASIEQLDASMANWQKTWDYEWGGDKGSQKFMLPENLSFLLDYGVLSKNKMVLDHVKNTLDKMLLGGIYDHLEGGFYRYSTDPYWKVPHFEKMLYDNAQLVSVYAKAYRAFKQERYKTAAVTTIAFLETYMRNSNGAFYATIDADSDGKEGAYYLWKKEELEQIITNDFNLFSAYYNINEETEIEEEKHVLFKSTNDEDFALSNDITLEKLQELKAIWVTKLTTKRHLRNPPKIDRKIITSWNALMINAYVEAYKAFNTPTYLKDANKVMSFIKEHLYKKSKLSHSIANKTKNENGFVEDYAFLIDASLNLYTVSLNDNDLKFAKILTEQTNTLFLDADSLMYRYTANNALITQIIKTNDGVIPSPNAVMAHNLLKLGHLLYNREYLDQADGMLNTMQSELLSLPNTYSVWGSILLKKIHPYYEVAIVGENALNFMQTLAIHYIPNTLMIGSTQESNRPLFKGRHVTGETYIYVCQNSTCQLPVDTPEGALKQLR